MLRVFFALPLLFSSLPALLSIFGVTKKTRLPMLAEVFLLIFIVIFSLVRPLNLPDDMTYKNLILLGDDIAINVGIFNYVYKVLALIGSDDGLRLLILIASVSIFIPILVYRSKINSTAVICTIYFAFWVTINIQLRNAIALGLLLFGILTNSPNKSSIMYILSIFSHWSTLPFVLVHNIPIIELRKKIKMKRNFFLIIIFLGLILFNIFMYSLSQLPSFREILPLFTSFSGATEDNLGLFYPILVSVISLFLMFYLKKTYLFEEIVFKLAAFTCLVGFSIQIPLAQRTILPFIIYFIVLLFSHSLKRLPNIKIVQAIVIILCQAYWAYNINKY